VFGMLWPAPPWSFALEPCQTGPKADLFLHSHILINRVSNTTIDEHAKCSCAFLVGGGKKMWLSASILRVKYKKVHPTFPIFKERNSSASGTYKKNEPQYIVLMVLVFDD
jgi:hypothetical protein